MINVLILGAGDEELTSSMHPYPVMLEEHAGRPVIEFSLHRSAEIQGSRRIVVVRDQERSRGRVRDVIKLLDADAVVREVRHGTGGAACTALLAVDLIDTDDELLVLNANELLDIDFARTVDELRNTIADAGIVAFHSVHPRYSYARLDDDGWVTEVAEKRPISRTATAGFYWFRTGKSFVAAAKRMIQKQAHVDGTYYVCPTLNELILDGMRIGAVKIESSSYTPLKENLRTAAGHY